MKKLDLTSIPELKPNREPELEEDGTPKLIRPVDFISENILVIDVNGMKVPECVRRLRLVDKLLDHADADYVLLEDEEHATLLKAFNDTMWRVASRAIVTLFTRIEKAETVEKVTEAAESA